MLLDASASMGYRLRGGEQARIREVSGSSLVYLAHLQRDAAGLIVFHDEVANFVRPSGAAGATDAPDARDRKRAAREANRFRAAVFRASAVLKRRGITILISRFFRRSRN